MYENSLKICNAQIELLKITRDYSDELLKNNMSYEEEELRFDGEILISIAVSLLSAILYDILKTLFKKLSDTINNRKFNSIKKNDITVRINGMKYNLIDEYEDIIKKLDEFNRR